MNGTIVILPATITKTCRMCGLPHNEPGVLCKFHRAQANEAMTRENARSNAVTDKRIWAQRAERRARPRTEWVEAV